MPSVTSLTIAPAVRGAVASGAAVVALESAVITHGLPKAAATLDRLETRGVPVIGWRSSLLAGFLATSAGLRLPARAETVDDLASILSRHWELGGAGVVVSQPLPGELAIPRAELAGDDATTARGPDRTPAELSRLQARLGDRVIRANVALLERNAALASLVALALNTRV